jgi:membrane-associated protease RseP (regulator of RpoE activity)
MQVNLVIMAVLVTLGRSARPKKNEGDKAMASGKTQDLESSERWYADDPLAQGNGFGIVLHEKDAQWVVAGVLRESPAEYCGVREGDVLVKVDDYELESGDSLELLYQIRFGEGQARSELTVDRENEGQLTLQIAPTAIIGILDTHGRLNGGLGVAGSCLSCKSCRQRLIGWTSCGKDCSGRCMVA